MPHRPGVATVALLVSVALSALPSPPTTAGSNKLFKFAAEMAKVGNWREANYRWEGLVTNDPDNPKLLNNLAVSAEALGNWEDARALYQKALWLSGGNESIEHNQLRFERFYRNTIATGTEPEVPQVEFGKGTKKGKTLKVPVQLPVPPRMDISDVGTLLVVSFLVPDENSLIDVNHELVRFLRSKFQRYLEVKVLDIRPAPAIPEQTLEDLIANHEFWRHLGREYDADLIVSGRVGYDRLDYSGFRDVDVISPATGQKVRTSRFVEQERFEYHVDLIFMDGATGELRHRDRLQRDAVYQGSQNDPIAAFFELNESMSADLLAIVKSRTREELRVIFKS